MQIIVGLLARDAGTVVASRPARLLPAAAAAVGQADGRRALRAVRAAYELDGRDAGRSRDGLLDELRFAKYLGYRVEELSGGTRQKLNLALALLHEPQLLLLDEPYAGFDWETYLRFWEMAERRRGRGMGILIVSHLLAERERLTPHLRAARRPL